MDWIEIAAAAIAGGLAALVAQLFVDRKSRQVLYLIVMLFTFFLLRGLLSVYVVPRIHLWQAEREIRAIPFYDELAKNDPQMYQQMRDILSEGIRKNESKETMAANFSTLVEGALSKYIGRASDDSVNGFVQLTVDEIEELDRESPDACYRFLFPKRMAPSSIPNNGLSPQRVQQNLAAESEVIRSAIHNPQPFPDAERSEALLDEATTSLAKQFGSDVLLVQKTAASESERHKTCQMSASLYEDILKFKKEDSSLVLRKLLSDNNTATGK